MMLRAETIEPCEPRGRVRGHAASREGRSAERRGEDRRGVAGPRDRIPPFGRQCPAADFSAYGAAPTIAAMIVNTSW